MNQLNVSSLYFLKYGERSEAFMNENAVAHFEIYADDVDKLGQFYTSLFDWRIEHVPGMDYRFIKTVETDDKGIPTQPGGINGGMLKRPEGYDGRAWVNYVNVKSVDDAVQRAQTLGARVMKARSAVPGMGWFAMLVDPQGNPFALWQTDASAQ
jgi:predicted enzyme related to lactoylglutathione lyase